MLLLWEYQRDHGEHAYKYTSLCTRYRHSANGLRRSMRRPTSPGDKLFIDHSGQTVPVLDAATGETRCAQIFVSALAASNYTYACATTTQAPTSSASSPA